MRIQVKIDGLKEAKEKLLKAGKSIDVLDAPIEEIGKMAKAALQSYPPYTNSWESGKPSFSRKKPGAKYRRTGALAGTFVGRKQKRGNTGLTYIVYQKQSINPSEKRDAREYSPLVLIASQQAPIHKGTWRPVEDWKGILEPKLESAFYKHLQKIIK